MTSVRLALPDDMAAERLSRSVAMARNQCGAWTGGHTRDGQAEGRGNAGSGANDKRRRSSKS